MNMQPISLYQEKVSRRKCLFKKLEAVQARRQCKMQPTSQSQVKCVLRVSDRCRYKL